MAELTPMRRQYKEMKELHPDCILFFRLGDFYEMFDEDALLASKELELTLTTRDRGKPEEERTPRCGVPYHSADASVARLISKGYKVAICEQMEDPALAKGLVEREVVRIVTPGTVIDSNMLEEGRRARGCASVISPPASVPPPLSPGTEASTCTTSWAVSRPGRRCCPMRRGPTRRCWRFSGSAWSAAVKTAAGSASGRSARASW